ncbi:acyloxyacyl hydrolase [Cesiribacter sp. SM1]|uniref:acyloxyacyl hydrolase n=1 Tax=Cesiribacter sp. SM1 TaxID=2861196 RepID=UPI001CD266CB|nr:acyloxyacyl hydrolase [Cesiribacter sp. SM1]
MFLFCLGCLFSSPAALAQAGNQPGKEPWSVGLNGYYGALFRYRAGLQTVNFTHPVGIELYANRHTLGKRLWEQKFGLPRIGFALSYYNYGVPDELGEALSLTAYLDKSILAWGRSSLNFNFGTGLVYSTRHYTPLVNEGNMAIGSRLTFALRGTLRYEFPLAERSYMNVNLAFRHFSNGGLNQPNNGMNFPLVGLGVRHQLREAKPVKFIDSTTTAIDRSIQLNLRLGLGLKEVLRIDSKHRVYNLSLYASKRLSYTNSFLVGVDARFDTALREEYINQALAVPEGRIDPRMAGVTIGHELHLSNLSFIFQLGRYVHQPHRLFPNYYQRYGLRYAITRNISANAVLLAHTRTANVIEWGLGFHL